MSLLRFHKNPIPKGENMIVMEEADEDEDPDLMDIPEQSRKRRGWAKLEFYSLREPN